LTLRASHRSCLLALARALRTPQTSGGSAQGLVEQEERGWDAKGAIAQACDQEAAGTDESAWDYAWNYSRFTFNGVRDRGLCSCRRRAALISCERMQGGDSPGLRVPGKYREHGSTRMQRRLATTSLGSL
jgi:hypothetical protein